MTSRKIPELILLAGFLCLACAPMLFDFWSQSESTASIEKRAMAIKPDPALIRSSFSDYATRFESYYNDSFGLRDKLIRWNNLGRLRLFGESPIRGVRVGKAGWLFYANEYVFEDYENVMTYHPEELARIRSILDERRRWLARRGIRFLVVVPPNKHTVYPEYLPPGVHKLRPESRYDQVVRALASDPEIEFVDLRGPLLKAKSDRRLYHRTDSHWNDYGAFIGYREIVERLARSLPNVKRLSLDDFTVSSVEGQGGDLAGMLSLSDVIHEKRILLTPRFKPRAVDGTRQTPDPVHHPGRERVVKETGDPALPRALVFRDSYSWGLIPYLSESFRSVVFLWTFDFLPEVIEREKPDVVILECVERYLNALTLENPEAVRAEEAGGA